MERKHGPWTIKSSECLHRDAFGEFWLDEVVKPDGEPGRYATMKMLPGVAVLALDEEGFVYLVKMFRYAIGRESIEAVAGGLEESEPYEEAARRELREEVGIEAGEMLDLGLVDAVTSQVFSPSRVYLARRLSFTETDREATERMETLKVTLEEAVEMVMDGRITQATSAVLILKASRVVNGC
jgi:8-oxo-dGTP pyrophosphatase MutT (NUDIX family)